MLSEGFIRAQKAQLTKLGDKLHKESQFAKKFIESSGKPQNEINWFRSVSSIAIHGTFQIEMILQTLDNFKDKPEEQISFYIGRAAIQSFLDTINAFEQSTNSLIWNSEELQKLLNKRIEEKIGIIKYSWKSDVDSKSKQLKQDIINFYKRKVFEMKFIRDTLKKFGVINDLDWRILEFAWGVRNSMHSDFLAIKDIEFSAPGTNLNYSFSFKKWEELYHPKDLSSFYSITEQIIYIQLKILQYFNKQKIENLN